MLIKLVVFKLNMAFPLDWQAGAEHDRVPVRLSGPVVVDFVSPWVLMGVFEGTPQEIWGAKVSSKGWLSSAAVLKDDGQDTVAEVAL